MSVTKLHDGRESSPHRSIFPSTCYSDSLAKGYLALARGEKGISYATLAREGAPCTMQPYHIGKSWNQAPLLVSPCYKYYFFHFLPSSSCIAKSCMDETMHIQQHILQTTLGGVKSEFGGDDVCVICLDRISEKALAFPCNHANFDFLCLISWLQEKATCPLCKSTVKSVQYDYNSATRLKTFTTPLPTPSAPTATATLRRPRRRPALSSRQSRHVTARNSIDYPSEDDSLARRRQVYRERLMSMHVGANRISQYRDFTSTTLSQDEALISRARKWIRRELQVFDFLGPENSRPTASGTSTGNDRQRQRKSGNAEFLLEYIIAVVKTVDLKGSGGQAEELLQEFLGRDNARIFIHELEAWLRSPYERLEDWDRHVQYKDNNKHQPISTDAKAARLRRHSPLRHQNEPMGWDSWRPPRHRGARMSGSARTVSQQRRHESRGPG